MYRHLNATKRVPGRKARRYTNLAVFNSECSTRGVHGNICELANIRKLKGGGGLASVRSRQGPIRGRPSGTWLLHFESHSLLKQHLKGRVADDARLAGARRKRRR